MIRRASTMWRRAVRSGANPPRLLFFPCVALLLVGFSWPLEGTLSSDFGARARGPHHGLDIAAAIGTDVGAMQGGVVVWAGPKGAYGVLVEVDHGEGWTTRYAHLEGLFVELGELVHEGEVLGTVGTSGNSTGPHLHLEVRLKGVPVDPFVVLP